MVRQRFHSEQCYVICRPCLFGQEEGCSDGKDESRRSNRTNEQPRDPCMDCFRKPFEQYARRAPPACVLSASLAAKAASSAHRYLPLHAVAQAYEGEMVDDSVIAKKMPS